MEQGLLTGDIVDGIIDYHLSDIKSSEIDALILGCTHYPLLSGAIHNYFGEGVELIECSKSIALEVHRTLKVADAFHEGVGSEEYFVTDDVSRFNALASLFLDKSSIDAVHVEELPSEGLSVLKF